MRNRFIFFCNAIDDATRLARDITGDSPAASRKVFLAAKAIRLAGVKPIILSLGRGKPDNSGRRYKAFVRRVGGVPVVYAPFSHDRIESLLLALFAPIPLLIRISKQRGGKTVAFYNRVPLYLPALLSTVIAGWRRVLDLEDGEIGQSWFTPGGAIVRTTCAAFEALCNGGALLACSALDRETELRPVQCYYGTGNAEHLEHAWGARPLTALMCGALWRETGALILAEAIAKMRERSLPWANCFKFIVTGSGSCLTVFDELSKDPREPRVVVLGRTNDSEYREVLMQSHIGLALKLNAGKLSNTTFPSKVVEFAGAGLLVLTTDVSDVRKVLGEGAVYAEKDDPELLIERLQWIAANPDGARAVAQTGTDIVRRKFSPTNAGRDLANFLFPTRQ